MSAPKSPVVVNGWTIFAHPLFLDQLETLLAEVERARAKDPTGFARKNAAKRLKAIVDLAFEVIPNDPAASAYRQGGTLGADHKHWFRAKFFQQYRLFFRYRQDARILVHVWVNDEDTKRAYDSRTDAYAVFGRMLKRGHPPDNWDRLLAEAKAATARLAAATDRIKPSS